MIDYLTGMFSTSFMPHGHCFLWETGTLWLHVVSDGLIGAAYYSIPFGLLYFVRRRKDLAFPHIFTMFGLFIFACGTTHFAAIVTTWIPYYRVEGLVKLATAGISVASAIALMPLIPRALRLPSPSQLEAANRELERQVGERLRAEAELRSLNETLEQRVAARTAELSRSNADLERFAYLASHDMTEPLRMVRGYLELLQRRYGSRLDADADEFIGIAIDGARRMQAHIDGLLEYARARSGPQELGLVDCEAVLDEVLQRLQVALADHRAQITREPLPALRADGAQLARLLQNLVSNALKFTGPAPRVHVGARRQDGGHVLVVRDHGPGIPPEESERVFEIFHRLRGPGDAPGTGIGLALCRTIAERHGGRIWVEPAPGGGAAFCAYLPEAAGGDGG